MLPFATRIAARYVGPELSRLKLDHAQAAVGEQRSVAPAATHASRLMSTVIRAGSQHGRLLPRPARGAGQATRRMMPSRCERAELALGGFCAAESRFGEPGPSLA
jgi:hypothetical protein